MSTPPTTLHHTLPPHYTTPSHHTTSHPPTTLHQTLPSHYTTPHHTLPPHYILQTLPPVHLCVFELLLHSWYLALALDTPEVAQYQFRMHRVRPHHLATDAKQGAYFSCRQLTHPAVPTHTNSVCVCVCVCVCACVLNACVH